MKGNYYSALGLPVNASRQELKRAFYNLSLKYHPDRLRRQGGKIDGEFLKRFHEVNEAYHCLIDDSKRKIYDETLLRNGKNNEQGLGEARSQNNMRKSKIFSAMRREAPDAIFNTKEHYRQHYQWPWRPTARQARDYERDMEYRKIREDSALNSQRLTLLSCLGGISIYVLYQIFK